MLDPLIAVGLASSIAQLIDFGAKLLKEAGDIRNHDASVSIKHIKKNTIDLLSLKEALERRSRLQGLNSNGGSFTQEEEVCSDEDCGLCSSSLIKRT